MLTELSRTKILDISKNDPDCGKTKCLALKNGLAVQHEQFFVNDDEMVNLLEDKKLAYILKAYRY